MGWLMAERWSAGCRRPSDIERMPFQDRPEL
jgi:hypothetical protein